MKNFEIHQNHRLLITMHILLSVKKHVSFFYHLYCKKHHCHISSLSHLSLFWRFSHGSLWLKVSLNVMHCKQGHFLLWSAWPDLHAIPATEIQRWCYQQTCTCSERKWRFNAHLVSDYTEQRLLMAQPKPYGSWAAQMDAWLFVLCTLWCTNAKWCLCIEPQDLLTFITLKFPICLK